MAHSSSSSVTDQPDAAGERGQSFYCRGGPVAPLGDGKTTNTLILHADKENRNWNESLEKQKRDFLTWGRRVFLISKHTSTKKPRPVSFCHFHNQVTCKVTDWPGPFILKLLIHVCLCSGWGTCRLQHCEQHWGPDQRRHTGTRARIPYSGNQTSSFTFGLKHPLSLQQSSMMTH